LEAPQLMYGNICQASKTLILTAKTIALSVLVSYSCIREGKVLGYFLLNKTT